MISTAHIKVVVKEKFKFANSVSEESALDIFRSLLIWNAIVLSRHSTRRLHLSETIYKNAEWIVYNIDYVTSSMNLSRLL